MTRAPQRSLIWSRHRGFTMVELMVSMTLALVVLASLVKIFVDVSGSNREMEKMNGIIENGRFAVQLLESDIVHAGYWGGHVPQFEHPGTTHRLMREFLGRPS